VDKSTHESVMDSKTRVILLKYLNSGRLSELNGILSTGKEANVYHAIGNPQKVHNENVVANEQEQEEEETENLERELAIKKIYRTTLNEFKNRSEYIEGEFRFRHQLKKSNSKKLINLWAEKEMRNLKRIFNSGINCPEPLLLKENILIMSFIGTDGIPAPSLKNVRLSSKKILACYDQCVRMMRKLYHECHLIHADLSEYNLLYHEGSVWMIDVSQSVEHDHPSAMDFLRKDCENISRFFKSHGVDNAMSTQELFNFITDVHLTEKDVPTYLEFVHSEASGSPGRTLADEGVFKQSFIPRTLSQVPSPMGELFDNEPAFHQTVTGLRSVLPKEEERP